MTDDIYTPAITKTPENEMKSGGLRWLMLFLSCCFLVGNYFCADNEGLLETSLEKDLGINEF